jgi:SAM-dependent methyltransferase
MFNGIYAELYDEFHSSKDYKNEVNLILGKLEIAGNGDSKGLDFGCGTGNHAAILNALGISVDGYDLSNWMIEVARRKFPNLRFEANLENLESNYDFTYCLFDVLSYQTSDAAAKKLLEMLYEKTRVGGQVLLDSWNRSGVRLSPPRVNSRSVESSIGTITRHVSPVQVEVQDLYELEIVLSNDSTGETVDRSIHLIRAWSPDVVMDMMKQLGFYNFELYNPANPTAELRDDDWRFAICARK